MSVMQVVGSSRISNTVYLGVASIYWTLYITITEFTLSFDVQTALILVTPAAGIASLLWILRIEEYVISQFFLHFLTSYPGGKFIRYHMGYSLLHVQPWKENLSSLEKRTIKDDLRNEVGRVLRSPLLKDETESLQQLFWLLISIPAVFALLCLTVMPPNCNLSSSLSVLVEILFVFIFLIRKREWPGRVLGLAFCMWLTDILNTISRRRDSFCPGQQEQFPLRTPQYFASRDTYSNDFIRRIEPWLNELTILAKNEDWLGFKKNFDVYIESQEIIYKQKRRNNLTNSLVGDAIWSFKRVKFLGPYPEDATISVDMFNPLTYRSEAKRIVEDSLQEIDSIQGDRLLGSWENNVETLLQGWNHQHQWSAIYETLTPSIISKLELSTIKALAELPFFMQDMRTKIDEKCKFRNQQRLWTLDLVLCLQKAVDQDLVDPLIVFMAASRWGIMPKQYIEQCSSKVQPLILEVESEIPVIELEEVIYRVMTKSPNIDVDKVAQNLASYEKDPDYEKLLRVLQHTASSKPHKPYAVRAKEILAKLGVDTSKLP